ncbi:MAG TPA: metallophosphoesterase [Burkholderiales bacterium]|jgi:calcineurin-like phosphoesterase family protein|nr:metallophosphoesterase [Burkholderiales bacterium]
MSERERLQREMDRVSRPSGERPDNSLVMTRRTFLHKSVVYGASAAACGLFPSISTIDMAFAQGGPSFKFAWLSDTHLYPKEVNKRFVEKTVRAVKEIQAMNPPADFLIFGGDLAQLGDPVELRLGADLLKEVTIKKVFIPGEHDWYLDMGATWNKMFGASPWTFDHKGVRFIGLDTVSRAEDFWTSRKFTAKERMGHMATLDGTLGGAWAAVGADGLKYLNSTLASWPKDKPVVVVTHNPLYEYYPPWNFWVRDWLPVQEILRPFANVTNIHGHTHQPLYNEIGKMRSIGMLATSWPWPYAPEGVPVLTKPMIRADPGDHFDGVGWSSLAMTSGTRVDYEYKMWRKEVFAQADEDSGTGDNRNQVLTPRMADRI